MQYLKRPDIENPVITMIIPVYNVEAYIDQCLDSIAKQTFRDFEVLLINDGSSDGSLERMLDWAEKDRRFGVIDKPNEGVSPSRNLGIEEARGEYLAFVDPDDWLDVTYLEKLYHAADVADADFAECDIWRYDNRSGKQIYRACYGRMGVPYTLEEHMKYGPTASYKAISRRSLWMRNSIRFPSCSFESPAVFSLVLALANKVVNVREPLYYYRRFRENSLVETAYADKAGQPDPELGIEAMRHLIREFRRTGIYDRYRDTLEGIVKYRLSDILAMQYHRRTAEEFSELVTNMRRFLQQAFPEHPDMTYFVWGSYNLGRITHHMSMLHDPSARYSFSSIAAVCDGNGNEGSSALPVPQHRNAYRRLMIEKEIRRAFFQDLAERQPQFLIMDLMEERFDLMETVHGILTDSDALQGAANREELLGEDSRRILRLSDDCRNLCLRALDSFFEQTITAVPGIRVIVMEDYLMELHGEPDGTTPYEERASIHEMNKLLAQYYGHIRQEWPQIALIRPCQDGMMFTDDHFEYGVLPQHWNELLNAKAAEDLYSVMMRGICRESE